MKLDFLDNLSANGKYKYVVSEQLIRLWDFGPTEARLFYELVKHFAKNESKVTLELHKVEFIESKGCKLTLIKDVMNMGIQKMDRNVFQCVMNSNGYFHILELIQPFFKDECVGYQWLDEEAESSAIDFLFSPGGTW